MPARPRRRAVGPLGARPADPAPPGLTHRDAGERDAGERDLDDGDLDDGDLDDARLRADRPPHHERGV